MKVINQSICILFVICLVLSTNQFTYAQSTKKVSEMSKAEILSMTNDELLNLSIEELNQLSEIVGVSVEELLDLSIKTGGKGGFGHQLEDLNITPYIHGYAAVWYRNLDFNRVKKNQTFSSHYFNPIIGVNIEDKIIAEIMMEYEHGGDEISLRYAMIDYAFSKYATLRAGKFLMPIGKFNEYLYPEHINIFPDRPISHWNILPSVYAEVGVQLRGHIPIGDDISLNYAAYIVNGLQQVSQKNYADSLSIRNMRSNNRDYINDKKSFGGRIGLLPMKGIELGASLYTGAFSADGKQKLSILCIDAEYQTKRIAVRGEFVNANQDIASGQLNKSGFYAEGTYRINKYFQPAIRYEQADIPYSKTLSGVLSTENLQKLSLGLVFYPEPDLLSRFTFKVAYNPILNDGAGKQFNEFVIQTAIGF